MSTTAAPLWGKDSALTRRAGKVLEPVLEPGDHVQLAVTAFRGRILTSLLIYLPGVIVTGMISGRWNAERFSVAGTAVYFGGFVATITLGTLYGLRPRVLVLTDRRLILCRQTLWLARPTDRIDVDQRRETVSTTWQTPRRFALVNPAGTPIKLRLRAGAKVAAAVKDWVEIPPFPIAQS